MTYEEFKNIVAEQPDGVILLEGRCNISPGDAEHAKELARQFSIHFPHLRFRSGNAEGSDYAFSEGVAEVNASRLQVIAPYKSHRKKYRYSDAIYDSPGGTKGSDLIINYSAVKVLQMDENLEEATLRNGDRFEVRCTCKH